MSTLYDIKLIYTELVNNDVLCVTETKLDNNVNSSELLLDNFQNPDSFRKDRIINQGGGILICIREGLLSKRRHDLEIPELESVCVEIITKNVKFLLVCFYRPPKGNAPATSWDHFENLVYNVVNSDCNVILVGDINVDLLKTGPTSRISRICQRYGIENVIQEPTRITSSTSTLIDPIYK
jgi:exonuclease III